MSPAARTAAVFGWYPVVMGVLLAAVPNALLTPFGIAATDEPWIRVLGLVSAGLGVQYLVAARHELLPFIRASVPLRIVIATAIAVIAFAAGVWQLAGFAPVEYAGAAWTAMALRRTDEGRPQ